MKKISLKINKTFEDAFGRTPLNQRLNDIFGEAVELQRFTDMDNLKEEMGDLLTTTIQGCTENGWNPEHLINATLCKIKRRELQYKSLGRKTKVAILGGAFNPVTNGHIAMARFVLDVSKTFDEVWLMPCFDHMNGKNMESAVHRKIMCDLAVKCDGRLKTFDYEIKNKLRGETYNCLKRLQNEKFAKDQYDFSIIIGMDNANTFDKWVNHDDLERMIRFVIVPRKSVGQIAGVNWYLNPPHIYLNYETDIPEVSSTEVRDLLKKQWKNGWKNPFDLWEKMDMEVLEYIRRNGLYK